MEISQSSLVAQRKLRLEKIKKLRDIGINPYPASCEKEYTNKEVVENFSKFENKKISLAGRLMSWREHGHIIFGNIRDDSGKIQLYIKEEVVQKKTKENVIGWDNFELLDIGDHIQVNGTITKTNTGEVSILVDGIVMLSKSIRPLPEKWHGISDIDDRFRRRYLDMTMNPEIRERFKRRSLFWRAVRDFLNDQGFVEINIPVLEHLTGGADARPFVTHFDALNQDFFLRISHELPLKRLLGAGFERVYDLGPRFRNEGFSEEHLPEHIAMEFYWAYADKDMGMKLTQEMFRYIAKKVYGKTTFKVKGFDVDLDKDWEIIDYSEIMKEKLGIDVFKDPVEKLNALLKEKGMDLGEETNRSRVVDNLWKLIRTSIGGPAFVVNIPKFFSPLAKADDKNPEMTQRVQPIIGGSEMASSWAELNDPIDQLERFLEQQKMREEGDEEAQMMDIDFVEMLEYGMPPAFGFGMSERVFWFLEDVTAREGVPFPAMKFEIDANTRKVYADIIKYIDPSLAKRKGQDFSKKMVIVVGEDVKSWELTNTIAHISAYLGNHIDQDDFVSREVFEIKDGVINANSQYPIIVLTGKQAQLKKLNTEVNTKGLESLTYIREMIEYTDDIKLQKSIKNKSLEELDIQGIGIFGNKEDLEEMTKKFSLYK